MAKILTSTKDLSHGEWLEYRRKGLGGSDAPTIVGFNPYNSLFRLYADKKGLIGAVEDNEAMRQGRDLEQYVAERFMEATGKKVRRRNYMFQSEEYPFMLADIDREVVGESAGLECKTTSAFAKSDFESGEIPLYYYAQMTHYMTVMGYDRMYLAVVVLGRGFYWFCIERDESEIASLVAAEREFWETCILADKPPELDGSEATANALKEMYPTEQADTIVSLPDDLMSEYHKLKQLSDDVDSKLDCIKAQIQSTLGDMAEGQSDTYKVTWKTQKRTTVDSKKLKSKYADIYSECSKESKSRVLKITEIKKKEG